MDILRPGRIRVVLPPPVRELIAVDERVQIDGLHCGWLTVDMLDRLVPHPIPSLGSSGVAFGVVLMDGRHYPIWTAIALLPGYDASRGWREEREWLNRAETVHVLDAYTERGLRRQFPQRLVDTYLAWCDNQQRL